MLKDNTYGVAVDPDTGKIKIIERIFQPITGY